MKTYKYVLVDEIDSETALVKVNEYAQLGYRVHSVKLDNGDLLPCVYLMELEEIKTPEYPVRNEIVNFKPFKPSIAESVEKQLESIKVS